MPWMLRIAVAGLLFLIVYGGSYYAIVDPIVDRVVHMKPGEPVRWTLKLRKLPEWVRPAADAFYWPAYKFDRRFVRKDYWYDYSRFSESLRERTEPKP